MSTLTTTQLQQQYIAYFGRPGDPAGIKYWLSSGLSEKEFAEQIHAQDEYKKSTIGGKSTEEQVNGLYKNLFGREADAAGLLYWTGEIEAGRKALSSLALDLIWSATNPSSDNTTQGDLDAAALANKVAAAAAFTTDVEASTSAILAYQPESTSPFVAGEAFTDSVAFISTATATNAPTAADVDAAIVTMQTAYVAPVVEPVVVAPTTYTLTSDSPTITEGDTDTKILSFKLTLDKAAEADVTVNYETLSTGTAEAGDDFVVASGTVVFKTGQSVATVNITTNNDTTYEDSGVAETVDVKFTGTSLTADVTGTGSITENDVAASTVVTPINKTLASTTDLVTGTSAADTISGSKGTIDGDTITAGDGIDTLTYTATVADDDNASFVATGLEKFSVRSTGGTANDAAFIDLELGDVEGLTDVTFRRLNDDVKLDNLQSLSTTINVEKVATAADMTVNFETSVVSGSSDTANATITTSTGGSDLTINGVETIAITATGDDNDLNIDGDKLSTVTIAGTGDWQGDVDASVKTLTASNAGGIVVNFTAAADTTVTGTDAVDTFNYLATLTKADTVNGGTGTDVLQLGDAATVLASGVGSNVTNVETIRLDSTDDSAVDTFTLDADQISGISTIIVDAVDENDSFVINDYVTTQALNVVESSNNTLLSLDVDLKDRTGASDHVTIDITNSDATTAFTTTTITSTDGGIETVTLDLNQGKDISSASDIIVPTMSIGATTLNLTGAADATIGNAAGAAVTVKTINGSTATGDLSILAGAAKHTITTGSGDDTISFAADVLLTTDTIDGGDGTDKLVAADLVTSATAPTINNIETVSPTFSSAGSTLGLANADTALTTLNMEAGGNVANTVTGIPSGVSIVRLSSEQAAVGAVALTYRSGSSTAHKVTLGDDVDGTAGADSDYGAITVNVNTGAFTFDSVGFATGNSSGTITAAKATSATVNSSKAYTNTGNLAFAAATSFTAASNGGAMTISGTTSAAKATAWDYDATDGNLTFTGATTATKATSLAVDASGGSTALFSGAWTSDADVATATLTADGTSSQITFDDVLTTDHVRTLTMTGTNGGTVRIDSLSFNGTDNTSTADVTTSIVMSATGSDTAGSGSTVTLSDFVSAASSTLDSATITTDSLGTATFVTGDANLTVTSIDASASAGTLTLTLNSSEAATDVTLGSGTNTVTVAGTLADVITLASAAGTDTIKTLSQSDVDATVIEIVNFEAGAAGDVFDIDVSGYNTGSTVSVYTGTALSAEFSPVITGVTDTATTLTTGAILKYNTAVATSDAVATALAGDITGDASIANNTQLLLLWTDGADSYLSTMLVNDAITGGAIAAYDGVEDQVKFTGVTLSDITSANFNFT